MVGIVAWMTDYIHNLRRKADNLGRSDSDGHEGNASQDDKSIDDNNLFDDDDIEV